MINVNNVCMLGKLTNINCIWQSDDKCESFYKAFINVKRNDHHTDIIPIIISGNMLKEIDSNELVSIQGQIRSKDVFDENTEKLRVEFYINVKNISNQGKQENDSTSINSNANCVNIDGYICKKPILRTTPSGKQITDLLIACNYGKDKTSYVHCIAWGRNARTVSKLKIGDFIGIEGKFQCRSYIKNISGNSQEKIAYELSIDKIRLAQMSSIN